MDKKMFVELFLERLVKASQKEVTSLEYRKSLDEKEYIMVNYKNEPPYIVNITGKSNLDTAIAVLTTIKNEGV